VRLSSWTGMCAPHRKVEDLRVWIINLTSKEGGHGVFATIVLRNIQSSEASLGQLLYSATLSDIHEEVCIDTLADLTEGWYRIAQWGQISVDGNRWDVAEPEDRLVS